MSAKKLFFSNNLIELSKKAAILEKDEEFRLINDWRDNKTPSSLQKILNSSREVREVLATDLTACNNYKNGINAVKKIKVPTLFIFGELDKMINLNK